MQEVPAMEILGYLILGCIGAGILFIAVKFTILIETPIIIHGGITENKKYISAINSITNVIFNVVLVFISFVEWPLGMIVWYAVAEFLLIPVSEILAYKAISKRSSKPHILQICCPLSPDRFSFLC